MKHLAAYLLLNLGGNSAPSASEIKAVLSSVGIDADENQLETLLSELKGKDIQTVSSCLSFPLPYDNCTNEYFVHVVDRGGLHEARLRSYWWFRRWSRRTCPWS